MPSSKNTCFCELSMCPSGHSFTQTNLWICVRTHTFLSFVLTNWVLAGSRVEKFAKVSLLAELGHISSELSSRTRIHTFVLDFVDALGSLPALTCTVQQHDMLQLSSTNTYRPSFSRAPSARVPQMCPSYKIFASKIYILCVRPSMQSFVNQTPERPDVRNAR